MFGITELPLVAPGRWARPFETPPALVAARRSHDSEGRRAARGKSARARSKRVRCILVGAAEHMPEFMRGGMRRQRAVQIGHRDRMEPDNALLAQRGTWRKPGPAAALDAGAAHRPIKQQQDATHTRAGRPAFQRKRAAASAHTTLEQIDRSLDEASSTLGAAGATTVRRVLLPLVKPAVVAALVYGFVRSVTTVSAVIFLVSGDTDMATTYIIGRVVNGDYGVAIAYSAVLIALMVAAILVIQWLVGVRVIGARAAEGAS